MQKLVKESIKTRNLIKRHPKKYSIPGFYEQCQKIRQILNKDPKLKNEFTIKDISYFFIHYHMLSKSIFKMNENELAESLKEYFYCESKLRYYYFRMDLDYRVVSNSRIGNGRIVPFSSLPQKGVVQILVFQAYLMSLYLHFIAFDFLYMTEFSCGRI